MKLRARGIKIVCGLACGGERVDEFRAGALAVRSQTRDVPSVKTLSGDEQVVAVAPGDAAQLQFARFGLSFLARRRTGERKPRVTLDALARREQRLPLRLAVANALARDQIFDRAQCVDRRSSDALDTLPFGGAAFVHAGSGIS